MTSTVDTTATARVDGPNKSSNSSGSSTLSLATYGAIDTTECSTPMWMVRIPPKLATLWKDLPEGTELGTLTFTKGTPSTSMTTTKAGQRRMTPPNNNNNNKAPIKQSLVLDLKEDLVGEDGGGMPLQYSCEALTKKVPTLHPFGRDAASAKIKVHGTVTRTCNLQMMRHSSSYRKMCQNRIYQQVSSSRFVKPVDAADLSLRRNKSNSVNVGFGDSIAKTGKRLLEAAAKQASSIGLLMDSNNKRIQISTSNKSTQGVVFELFSQQPFWTVKELRSASGGVIPEKDIRAVLAEVAEFRRSGEHKGMWELKSEYRSTTASTTNTAANDDNDNKSDSQDNDNDDTNNDS